MVNHLYVHIPFCPKVCPYCSFYKETSDRNKTNAFLDALLEEASRVSCNLQPRTIFFGGGTPTALSTPQLQFLITGLRERLDFSQVEEFTIEMNPATVSHEKAGALLALGVNRVSMGVQSWDDGLLKTLGRVHSGAQAERSYQILREVGFPQVNLDLIFGIPGQSSSQWHHSLLRTVELGPDHISAYCLTYEEDTEFFLRFQTGEFQLNDARDADFFEMAMDVLEPAGYAQYEISNYARAGRSCLHNIAYWHGADYLGLGPSAFSTHAGRRWRNIPDTAEYTRRVLSGEPPWDVEEFLDRETLASEVLAFSLRTSVGISQSDVPVQKSLSLESLGVIERSGDRFLLTRRGKLLADEIAAELL